MSTVYVGNTLFTGSHTGEIHPWTGSTKGKSVKAHTSKCTALFVDKQTLISGGADGTVIQWTVNGASLTKLNVWDIKTPAINSALAEVISVHKGPQDQLLVGTRGSEIIEFKGKE